jgi:hypothetical protein
MNKRCLLGIIAVVMLLGGCIMRGESGRRLDAALLHEIIPEQMGKDGLYTLCGWPSAIILPDDTASLRIVPPLAAATPLSRGVYRVDTAAYYELFARRRTLGEAHQIVYYEHLTSHKFFWMLLILYYSQGEATADRLWVLVNEETGLVEDYAFKKHGAPTIFAGDAPSVPR